MHMIKTASLVTHCQCWPSSGRSLRFCSKL